MEQVKNLSEAIILQCLEDLYSKEHRMEALAFFNGEGFGICASVIGLNYKESRKIFDIVKMSRPVKQFVPPVQIKDRIKHDIPAVSHRVFPRNFRHETVCYP
ncbi:MAG: hypothetical protein HZA11_13650 [Nitrospirae bacterium]|nr:hypothetical protein [Nitrospirota bacterium]